MDDTEQPVGWILLGPSMVSGRMQIYGRDNKYGEHALEDPYPLEARAYLDALKGDQILTLQEARAWLTLQSL